MSAGLEVHVVVPEGVDDPARPSGGNSYDLRLCGALADLGWSVRLRQVAGAWPSGGEGGCRALAETLRSLPDGALVLVDGLVASCLPELLVPAARRLRLVVLLHMPVGIASAVDSGERERAVLSAAAAVVATSDWSRRWLLTAYDLDPRKVHVSHPGAGAAEPADGTRSGTNLLCVGAVSCAKGHDLLVSALTSVADLPWHCVCVGSLTRAPDEVAAVRRRVEEAGLVDRVVLAGPRTGPALDASYAAADLLVHASRAETYGMVVTEALARGLPVLAAGVGGVPEALGVLPDGRRPGVLVPPQDAGALAAALREWLTDGGMRENLRAAVLERRASLTGWDSTADRVAAVLTGVAA